MGKNKGRHFDASKRAVPANFPARRAKAKDVAVTLGRDLAEDELSTFDGFASLEGSAVGGEIQADRVYAAYPFFSAPW